MNVLNTELNVFIDNGYDDVLAKSMNKSGLVQVQRTIKGKYGTYTRMQWVKASDVGSNDKIVKMPSYVMKESEAEERNSIADKNSKARLHSYKYHKGTVVEVSVKVKNSNTTKKVIGIVKSVAFSSDGHTKFTDLPTAVSGTSIQIEDRYGNVRSFNTLNPNCDIKKADKSTAEKFTGGKMFPHKYFPVGDFHNPLTEQEVLELYNERFDEYRTTFDRFVSENFFDSDGYNETQEYYKKDGEYIPERQALHNEIIEKIVSQASLPPVGSKPIAYLFGGGSASGKSSVVNKEVSKASEALGIQFGSVDSDVIKESIPEYEHFKEQNLNKGALRVHNESSDIANAAVDRLIESGKCFSFDGTMKNFEKYNDIIDKLKDAGYEVRIAAADIPVDEAIMRSDLRAKKSGRKVPHGIIIGSHGGFSLTYPKLTSKVDAFCLYDNSQPEGEEPTLIMDQNGIYNQEMWDRFIKKGKDYIEYKNSRRDSHERK